MSVHKLTKQAKKLRKEGDRKGSRRLLRKAARSAALERPPQT
jgi:hypothetical protein